MKKALYLFVTAALILSCSDEASKVLPGEKSHKIVSSMTCNSGENCQDVYTFTFVKGSVVTVSADSISGNGQVQIAFYAPATALGATNLFTNSTSEADCMVNNCANGTNGISISNFTIPSDGVYQVAVTRNWGWSCDSGVTYRLHIESSTNFVYGAQSVNDTKSLAPADPQCP